MSSQSAWHLRDLAVLMVDGRHGYTMEFSAWPEVHREEYDREAERLLDLGPNPVERIETPHASMDWSSTYTKHAVYARCPECGHSTVGLERPWIINHTKACSVPTEGYGDA